jgi:hypothetical protein
MEIKDVIDKVSSYNLFNYLLPGFLFNTILCQTTSILEFDKLDLTYVVIIYFEGLVISRIGSIVFEELLLKYHRIKTISTSDLFKQFKNNTKLEIIFEAMNMYRTLATMSILLSFCTLYDIFVNTSFSCVRLSYTVLEFSLFILFLLSFIKQRKKVVQCLE